jgi:hypothetical protein
MHLRKENIHRRTGEKNEPRERREEEEEKETSRFWYGDAC